MFFLSNKEHLALADFFRRGTSQAECAAAAWRSGLQAGLGGQTCYLSARRAPGLERGTDAEAAPTVLLPSLLARPRPSQRPLLKAARPKEERRRGAIELSPRSAEATTLSSLPQRRFMREAFLL
ncbi:hypothetical protein CYMTET_5146 [Cymbomonas tetramitiformis]|uniref:Uncharacterized protein n=1 Tax=Cymbomonas tetramitiformis TaxID=36881 RepID=A0AAE0H1N5_9CHLO|nr:hypothetical protein CYMTET_5146 [Cymbomonas tetramitiformis]